MSDLLKFCYQKRYADGKVTFSVSECKPYYEENVNYALKAGIEICSVYFNMSKFEESMRESGIWEENIKEYTAIP